MKKPPKFPAGSPQEWLNHAQSDLAFARLGLKSEEVLAAQVCFHAQQAVEKVLKMFMLYNKIPFPPVHDIETLIEIVQHAGLQLPEWANEAADLTPYAVETRYPGHWETFQDTEVHKALEIARQAIEWAKMIIAVK
ncbi:MAG: HEPN domain-containing protein [Candidatus Schekmanbacteria bacterium]|nr:HEPN domain-containing protein [Candidatus Schekmanbacteria bacterium]